MIIKRPYDKIANQLHSLNFFNSYESSVYLTLIQEGVCKAKLISEITSIPYGKVYEILTSLITKGFVVLLPNKPKRFKPINPEMAINNYKKDTDIKFNDEKDKILIKLIPMFNNIEQQSEINSDVVTFTGRFNTETYIQELIKTSKTTLNIMITPQGLSKLLFHKELLEQAKARGVNITIITKRNSETREDIKSLDFCYFKSLNGTPISNYLITVDNNKLLIIEPIPDTDNIAYGRDKGIYIINLAIISMFNLIFKKS